MRFFWSAVMPDIGPDGTLLSRARYIEGMEDFMHTRHTMPTACPLVALFGSR